jgi:hypothetical protein
MPKNLVFHSQDRPCSCKPFAVAKHLPPQGILRPSKASFPVSGQIAFLKTKIQHKPLKWPPLNKYLRVSFWLIFSKNCIFSLFSDFPLHKYVSVLGLFRGFCFCSACCGLVLGYRKNNFISSIFVLGKY